MRLTVPLYAICAIAAAASLIASQAGATVLMTTGAGSAVSSPDRTATFDSLSTGSDKSAYAENSLSVTVPVLDYTLQDLTGGHGGFSSGFFYANSSPNPVIVTTTDSRKITALEFNVGTGYSPSSNNVFGAYEIINSSIVIASGTFSVLPGSVIGFTNSDATGLDALYLGAYGSLTDAQTALTDGFTGVNDLNAAAVDNLKTALAPAPTCGDVEQPPCDVPEPTSLLLFATAFVTVICRHHRRRS